MKICLSPAPECYNRLEMRAAERGRQCLANFRASVFRLLAIGQEDDLLRLHPDFNEMDIGWSISRPQEEEPYMVGLLHFDGLDSWSSHT